MRTIGIITKLNPIVIKIYDVDTSKVIDITPTQYDEAFDYQILSPIEYHKDTNSINILPNINLTELEKNYLMKAFLKATSSKKSRNGFLRRQSDAFPPETFSSRHK